jgi:hypothetical protein
MFLLVGKIPETEEKWKCIELNLLMHQEKNWTLLSYTVITLITYACAATSFLKIYFKMCSEPPQARQPKNNNIFGVY